MKKKLLAGLATGLFFAGVSTTHATIIQNDFGLSSSHSTITFDEHVFSSGTVLYTEYSDLGVNFSPFAIYYAPGLVQSFWPYGPAPALRDIVFTQPQTETAFQFVTYPGVQFTFQALSGGSIVESGTAITSSAWGTFYGFQDITFDTVRLQTNAWPAWAVDNIQLSTSAPVPEPATMLLMGTGLAGLVAARRRKKA